ncbi:MAG: hypothetical protein AVDCRST_MAG35-2975, partial [uncultured Quadrisphaera sp.]
ERAAVSRGRARHHRRARGREHRGGRRGPGVGEPPPDARGAGAQAGRPPPRRPRRLRRRGAGQHADGVGARLHPPQVRL